MKISSQPVQLLSALALASTCNAFAPVGLVSKTKKNFALKAATIEEPITTNEATSWECNDEAECVEVPACDEESCRTSLDVRIHGDWYDLTGR